MEKWSTMPWRCCYAVIFSQRCGKSSNGDYHQQAQAGEGFDAQHITIDWDAQQAICPVGCRSYSIGEAVDRSKLHFR